MTHNLLHGLGELFGIKNYSPASATEAHFSLESNGITYILDAHIEQEHLLLCLSRPLLPHEEQDKSLLEKAAQTAHKQQNTYAFCKNAFISFMKKIPLSASMVQLEESLSVCISCQSALREE